ncbi:Putative DNA helicase ino80 [Aspergillus wentii]
MTGPPPYNSQSPPQQPHYPVYSPPNKNPPYYAGNDQYPQHPPQTPPAFPAHASLSRSPRYNHAPSPLPGTLPPLNGSGAPPPHADSSSQFQAHPSTAGTPQFPLPRPYSASVMPGNGASPYGHSTPSHAHPSSRPESHSQSPPKKEPASFPIGGNGYPSIMRESRPASPPKETVCFLPTVSQTSFTFMILLTF